LSAAPSTGGASADLAGAAQAAAVSNSVSERSHRRLGMRSP
jgi:hypothetical protein